MSTSDEILQALQQAGAGIGQGLAAANAAKAKTEQAIQQAAALGSRDKIAEFTALKAAIDELIASLSATREKPSRSMRVRVRQPVERPARRGGRRCEGSVPGGTRWRLVSGWSRRSVRHWTRRSRATGTGSTGR